MKKERTRNKGHPKTPLGEGLELQKNRLFYPSVPKNKYRVQLQRHFVI